MTAAHEQRLNAIQEFREPLSRLARRMEISRMTERDWDRIEQAGYTQFVANPVAEAAPRHRVKLRGKRHEQYSEAYRNFRDVMESSNPPQSKEEAIRQIVGLLGRLLAVIFPQYALLITIIGFLWDLSTGTKSTISGVAVGASEGRV